MKNSITQISSSLQGSYTVALQKKLDAAGVANGLHTGIPSQSQRETTLIVDWLKSQFK